MKPVLAPFITIDWPQSQKANVDQFVDALGDLVRKNGLQRRKSVKRNLAQRRQRRKERKERAADPAATSKSAVETSADAPPAASSSTAAADAPAEQTPVSPLVLGIRAVLRRAELAAGGGGREHNMGAVLIDGTVLRQAAVRTLLGAALTSGGAPPAYLVDGLSARLSPALNVRTVKAVGLLAGVDAGCDGLVKLAAESLAPARRTDLVRAGGERANYAPAALTADSSGASVKGAAGKKKKNAAQ